MDSLLLVVASTALALLTAWVIRRRLGFVTTVESLSMAPTLAPGQRLLTRRQGERPLRRGDIVVVDSTEVGRPLVKRVVGLPGEHVDVDRDGRVRVAGRELSEPYVVHRGGRSRRSFDVPGGHLLLLGDNRAGSDDARVWREPYLPVSAVLGRVVRRR